MICKKTAEKPQQRKEKQKKNILVLCKQYAIIRQEFFFRFAI